MSRAAALLVPLAGGSGGSGVLDDLLSMQIPPTEKVIRTVTVYLGIALIVRFAGKRLMAQMNSLDLVVVLLLSNVVQNAIIGDDTSLSGGLVGAVVLVFVNAGLDRWASMSPRVRWLLEGRETTIVRDGVLDDAALRRLGMTRTEFASALRHQADGPHEVRRAVIAPGGDLKVDLKREEQAASFADLCAFSWGQPPVA
ncbi:MAG TPA: YetF domain-containing protein [Dermatophilaceae bacterium]|nr:YetF domain-containing protein [Dermatophilaceae bacterium]